MTDPNPDFPFGESAGRIEVPLPALPHDVAAFTVPKSASPGSPESYRVPRDRKGRVSVRRVDLLPRARAVPFALPASLSTKDLIWVLRTDAERRWPGMVTQFGDKAWQAAMELVRSGLGVLRCTVHGFDYRPQSFRLTEAWRAAADDYLKELTGRPDPDTARSELCALMQDVHELHGEQRLLAVVEPGSPLRVPSGSKCATTVWSVYEAAIRAACYWFATGGVDDPPTAKDIASHAFNDSKRWTPERAAAFANLVDMPFALAVREADVEVLMRGPLVWRVGSVVADARTSEPWIGVPAGGIRLVGTVDISAVRGVFVVENKDTFEQVCGLQEVVSRWLCVWGRGYASNPLAAVLSAFGKVPMAAWCDLDADGLSIIANLSARLDRTITPIGMDVALWQAGPFRKQTPQQLERGRKLAANIAASGPRLLQPIACEIAKTGDGREQESLHRQVLPTLGFQLRQLESSADEAP
ncbi:uncharacterized protein DUF2220 [Lentzea atacamensis]|uniref:Uncharacterized protein DUF2220 n=1 Tax=Lentzea atacamensis TaxID=531938 RepID=A0ABX9DZJ9_9PSEU|nr:Wadjet anti-phage system protein JetD domain-containing protein [Lentzea atacamensis]RAS61280.1 uncharacterized protein DUF2220 [Lentzea atacamensis]